MYDVNLYMEMIRKENVLTEYQKKGRYYHTEKHLLQMFKEFHNWIGTLEKKEHEEIILAIIYHDVVYDINRSLSSKNNKNILSNEKMSAKYFLDNYKGDLDKKRKNKVAKLIELTETPEKAKTYQEKLLMFIDFSSITYGFDYLKNTALQMFKEFQKVPYKTYKDGRKIFCKEIGPKIVEKLFKDDEIFGEYYPKFIEGFKQLEILNEMFVPKIGIYAGSFKPFHIGHNNVLEKAEKIFDKVIIVSAVKKGKEDLVPYNIPNYLEQHIDTDYKLITDIIEDIKSKTLDADISIIRGIRNDYDLIEEQNYDQVLKDLGNDLPIIHILSDRKYSHVSSSLIRELENIDGTKIEKSQKGEIYLLKIFYKRIVSKRF